MDFCGLDVTLNLFTCCLAVWSCKPKPLAHGAGYSSTGRGMDHLNRPQDRNVIVLDHIRKWPPEVSDTLESAVLRTNLEGGPLSADTG